jgi:hypothetical protein
MTSTYPGIGKFRSAYVYLPSIWLDYHEISLLQGELCSAHRISSEGGSSESQVIMTSFDSFYGIR